MEVMEMQLLTWAHSMGREDTLVSHPSHGQNPTPSVPKTHGGRQAPQTWLLFGAGIPSDVIMPSPV